MVPIPEKRPFVQLRACPAYTEKFDRSGHITMEIVQPSPPKHKIPITRPEEISSLFRRNVGRKYFDTAGKESDEEFDGLDTELADQLLEVYEHEKRIDNHMGILETFLAFTENLGIRKVMIVYGDDATMNKVAKAIDKIGKEAGL